MESITFEKPGIMVFNGKEYLMIPILDFEDSARIKKFISETPGRLMADIRKYRQKRSLDANAYFWKLCGELAATLRLTTTEIYRNYVTEIGGNFEVMPIRESAVEKFKAVWASNGLGWVIDDLGRSKIEGYRNIKAYYGSSTYNSDQMGRLIDLVVQDCQIQGIETRTPAEIEGLKREWQAGGQK